MLLRTAMTPTYPSGMAAAIPVEMNASPPAGTTTGSSMQA